MSGGASDYLRKNTLEERRIGEAIDSGRVLWGGTSSHSSNDFTVTLTIPMAGLLTGTLIRWIPDAANTGAATLTVKDLNTATTLASAAIKRADGSTALSSGDMPSGVPVNTLYDGTVHRLLPNIQTGSLNFAGGTWTPTYTGVANTDSVSSGDQGIYLRCGNIVICGALITVDVTTGGGTQTRVRASLPVSSNFASQQDAVGCFYSNSLQEGGGVFADTTNDQIELRWASADTGNQPRRWVALYQIL